MTRHTSPRREIRLQQEEVRKQQTMQREEARKQQKNEEFYRKSEFILRIVEVIILGSLTAFIAWHTDHLLDTAVNIQKSATEIQTQVAAYQPKFMEYAERQATALESQKELQKTLNKMLDAKTEIAAVLFEQLACSDDEKADLVLSLLSTSDQRAIDIITSRCKNFNVAGTLPANDAVQIKAGLDLKTGLDLYEGKDTEFYTKQPIKAGMIWCRILKQNNDLLGKIDQAIIKKTKEACDQPASPNYMEAADLLYPELKKIIPSRD